MLCTCLNIIVHLYGGGAAEEGLDGVAVSSYVTLMLLFTREAQEERSVT